MALLILTVPSQSRSQATHNSEQSRAERTEAEASAVANALSRRLESPFCPGKSLEMCPSSDASQVRRQIYEFARDGLSKPAIKRRIKQKYGDQVKMKTPTDRDNTTLGVLLVLVLMGCIGLIAYLYRSSTDVAAQKRPEDDEIERPENQILVEQLRDEYK